MITLGDKKPARVNRRLGIWAFALPAVLIAFLAFAYSPEQDKVNNMPVHTAWNTNSVFWNLNPATGLNVNTSGGVTVQAALTSAFSSWQNAQLTLNGQAQTVDQLTITLRQVSTSLPTRINSTDCVNVVSFMDPVSTDFPTGTIAFTALTTVTPLVPGQLPPFQYPCSTAPTPQTCNRLSCITDADIEFNPKEQFSTSTPPLAGHFDIQSTATHEIGHMLGLNHSGIAHTIMFPFGDTKVTGQQRNLAVDDAAGIAFIYAAPNFPTLTGKISGKVTLNGSGIFASHVVAVDSTTGAAVLDGLTNSDGTYELVGLPPGSYYVLALPLAGVYTLDDFGGWSCGYAENSPPCCDPTIDKTCTGTPLKSPTNYTGKFF